MSDDNIKKHECSLCGSEPTHRSTRGNLFCDSCAPTQGLEERHRFQFVPGKLYAVEDIGTPAIVGGLLAASTVVAHRNSITKEFVAEFTAKYDRGQREHGGNLWEDPTLLDKAIEEVQDLVAYLYTERQRRGSKEAYRPARDGVVEKVRTSAAATYLDMTFNAYQHDAVSTISHSPDQWPGGLLAYHALGLAEEAGETVGKIKKALRRYESLDSPEVKQAVLTELGDVLWYMAAMCHDMGATLQRVAIINIEKRADRQARGTIKGEGDER